MSISCMSVNTTFVSTSLMVTTLRRSGYMCSEAMTFLCQASCTMQQCSAIMRLSSFVVKFMRLLSRSLPTRLLPHLAVALCSKCETFEDFRRKEVTEVSRHDDPGTTEVITSSAFCSSSSTSLPYSLGDGVDKDEVEPVVVPENRESHKSIVVHYANTR